MGIGWKPVMPLGWKPADDDNAEDADADDDAAGRFRLIFLVGTKRKSSIRGRSSPAACPAAQLVMAGAYVILIDIDKVITIDKIIIDGALGDGSSTSTRSGMSSSVSLSLNGK